VEHFNDGDGDMVHVALGNESFVIGYEMWKMIGRNVEDEHDGMFDEEDAFECDGCGGCDGD
jgi:hypothetical protein